MAAFLWSLFYGLLCGEGGAAGQAVGDAVRQPQDHHSPGWRSNGRREARRGGGVRMERGKRSQERIFLGTREEGAWKGKCGSPACANQGNRADTWTLKFYTQ